MGGRGVGGGVDEELTITEVLDQQRSTATAILWYQFVAAEVVATKLGNTATVEDAQGQIAAIEATALLSCQPRRG